MELPNSAVVRASSVVLVMAAGLGVQGFLLLVHRIVPVLFAPFPDCLQPSTKPFGNRLHVHCELPLSAKLTGLTGLFCGAKGLRVGATTSEIARSARACFKAVLPTKPVAPSSKSLMVALSPPGATNNPSSD
jgi:hypothetical protein